MRVGIVVLIVLMSMSMVAAATDDPVVVVNSRNWQDLYLGAIYASHLGGDLIYFTNLGDAQLKTQTIRPSRHVIALESSRPVVRNYESVLRTNGFSSYETHEFETYRDLQMELFDERYEAIVVLDPTFGPESVAFAPAIGTNMRPFFLDSDTRSDLPRAQRSADRTIIAGRFPVRLIDGIEADERYTAMSTKNADDITRWVAERSDSEWGIVMRIDRVDFLSLVKALPIVVYSGSLPDTVSVVRDIGIDRYEIISADAANLGQQIREGVGRQVSFMLKYGRTITNLPGMTGKILDLDTVYVDFPSPDLTIESVEHYTDAQALLVRYRNRGNIDTFMLTNIEYADTALTDDHLRVIPPGVAIDVPYFLIDDEQGDTAFINARYGMSVPLSRTLLSAQGTQLVREQVAKRTSDNLTLSLIDVTYDDDIGILSVTIDARTPGVARVEIPLTDDLTFTSGGAEDVSGRHTFEIDTPFHRMDTFSEPIEVVIYQGSEATVYEQRFTVTPRITRDLITGNLTMIASGALVFVLIALIAGLIIYLRRR